MNGLLTERTDQSKHLPIVLELLWMPSWWSRLLCRLVLGVGWWGVAELTKDRFLSRFVKHFGVRKLFL